MRRVPLVRTEGKEFADGPTLSAEKFVTMPALARSSKTSVARAAEDAFDLGDCLYFYAGHACPDFGDVVLVYDPEWADEESGNATPFDSGGLHLGYVHANGIETPDARAEYCRAHIVPLSRWRGGLSDYLDRHFESASSYILGDLPIHDDSTGRLHHTSNSRRAWTWEVRVHRDHPLGQRLERAWLSSDYYESVRQAVALEAALVHSCRDLLTDGTIRRASSSTTAHRAAEEEMASCL